MSLRSVEQYFIRIFQETYTSVLSYVSSRCKNQCDIEDIMQEAYADFYSRIKKNGFDDLETPGGLIMTIAKRKIFRYYKQKKESSELLTAIQDPNDNEGYVNNTDSEIENEVLNKIILEKVWNDIAFEGKTVLQIIKMRHLNDLTFKDISIRLGLPESVVTNNYYRTLEKIKKNYTEEEKKLYNGN